MAITGIPAVLNVPVKAEIFLGTGTPSGTVSVGDWLVYSGQSVAATYAGGLAYWKASAAGIAIENNSAFDAAGRVVINTGLKFVRQGIVRVTAAFSGTPALGIGAYPISTGSGVAAPTGLSGLGSRWQTGAKLPVSGGTGGGGSGVALVVGWDGSRAVAGTGQLDLLLLPPRPDYY